MSLDVSSRKPFVRASDTTLPASLGTGVTQTLLNNGAPLTTPNEARNLIGIMPAIGETGAMTAGESLLWQVQVTSKAIANILPKNIVPAPVMGGLGTFATSLAPALTIYPFNTPLNGNEDVNYYGQPLTTNTVAPEAFVSVFYSNYSPNPKTEPHVFWDGPTDETSTGTSQANGIVGGTFTVNSDNGAILRYQYTVVSPGVVTASESYYGDGSITSNDFATSMPAKAAFQTIATGLGTAVAVGVPSVPIIDQWIPMNPTAKLQTYLDLYEALTAAGNFYVGTGYLRT